MEVTNALGRRKTAVARVFLKKGEGKITINHRDYKVYFSTAPLQFIVNQSFLVTDNANKYDVTVNVAGGGYLKAHGLTTRDPRMVERKKFGRAKARKRFQFSKR